MTISLIDEPTVLTAKTYFWRPAGTSSGRRANEKRRAEEVGEWLEHYGFTEDGNGAWCRPDGIVVRFAYTESCHHVYKNLQIDGGGRKHNLTWLRNRLLV